MRSSSVEIEKIMSLDLADFHRGLKALTPEIALLDGQTDVEVSDGDFAVRISYEPMARETLGGLLKMPRAKVRLASDQASEGQWGDFLARFDKAFQRGGG